MFRGDGFMAVVRGQYHARRAVDAALDMNPSIQAFNEPRRLLGLPEFSTRVGISTGEMCFGNAGTYDKLDFTAIGRAVNLGADRAEGEAEAAVCEPGDARRARRRVLVRQPGRAGNRRQGVRPAEGAGMGRDRPQDRSERIRAAAASDQRPDQGPD